MIKDKTMGELTVVQMGTGAVGSHAAHRFAEENVSQLILCDKDTFEAGNFKKSSSLLDAAADQGQPKAHVMKKRLLPIVRDTRLHEAYCNLTRLGPLAYKGVDVVSLGLDNATAKLYVASTLAFLPADERPVVVMGGTYEDFYVGRIHPPGAPCLRCAQDPGPEPDRVWSCTDPGYLIEADDTAKDNATLSASENAAETAVTLLKEYLDGTILSGQSVRFAPHGAGRTIIPRDKDCPCCRTKPITDYTVIPGSYMSTLDEVFEEIGKQLGRGDFVLSVQRRALGRHTYAAFVREDYCLGCGKLIPVNRHTSLIRASQVLCPGCTQKYHELHIPRTSDNANVLRVFRPGSTPDDLLNTPMYFLGFSVGGFLEVVLPGGVRKYFALADDIGALTRDLFLP